MTSLLLTHKCPLLMLQPRFQCCPAAPAAGEAVGSSGLRGLWPCLCGAPVCVVRRPGCIRSQSSFQVHCHLGRDLASSVLLGKDGSPLCPWTPHQAPDTVIVLSTLLLRPVTCSKPLAHSLPQFTHLDLWWQTLFCKEVDGK